MNSDLRRELEDITNKIRGVTVPIQSLESSCLMLAYAALQVCLSSNDSYWVEDSIPLWLEEVQYDLKTGVRA